MSRGKLRSQWRFNQAQCRTAISGALPSGAMYDFIVLLRPLIKRRIPGRPIVEFMMHTPSNHWEAGVGPRLNIVHWEHMIADCKLTARGHVRFWNQLLYLAPKFLVASYSLPM